MRQTTGIRKSPGEKIVNDIKRATLALQTTCRIMKELDEPDSLLV